MDSTEAIPIGEGLAIQDFEAIVRLYRPRIFRFALACLRDRDAAESVAQDCFMRAHRGWGRFRAEASIQTWLMRIALNLIRDQARSRRFQFWKRNQKTAPNLDSAGAWIPDSGLSPEARLVAREQIDAIWSVLENLPDTQRTVFLLHFLEEMDAAEIEAATGISRASVKVHLFRAVRAVRQRLAK